MSNASVSPQAVTGDTGSMHTGTASPPPVDENNDSEKSPIGILGCLPAEILYLLSQLRKGEVDVVTEEVMGRQFFKGRLKGRGVVVVESGVGKANAAITTTLLVTHFKVSGVIVTGVAGALVDRLKTGDVVVSMDAREHDFGHAAPEGFELGISFYPGLEYAPIQSISSHLYDIAVNLIPTCQPLLSPLPTSSSPKRRPVICEGHVASGDTFVGCPAVRKRIQSATSGDVVEMEGAGVLRASNAAKIPCLFVRTVSDDATDHVEFTNSFEVVACNSGVIVESVVSAL